MAAKRQMFRLLAIRELARHSENQNIGRLVDEEGMVDEYTLNRLFDRLNISGPVNDIVLKLIDTANLIS